MDTRQAAWQPLGPHLFRVVDDILFLQPRGTLELSDMHDITCIGGQQISRYGYHLTIVDATFSTAMTPAARRYNAQWVHDNPDSLGCAVVHSAHLMARVIVTMIMRATALLSSRPAAVYFVADEAAALACMARERQRIVAELSLRPPQR